MDAIRNGVHEAMKDNWFFTRDFETVIDDYSRSLEMKNSVTVEENNEISNSQRKYIPQIGSLFPGIEPNQSRRKVTQLIVVASLVDKTTNIAGLCRSAEVFGAQRLVVPSMSILKEAQFSAMSVTAEQWIDVEEVPETRLAGYLSNMKSSGYTVVCLEQTHDSVEIQNFKFPEKCCLVLGNEKSGVPVHFLPCMDVCVEIPQRGVIRSLNVHVSGAIAMWQYNQCR
jgi:tRNA G18 (ribose-2'-O)-methylase SpoU